MKHHNKHQWFHWIKHEIQLYWLPLLLGIVLTAVAWGFGQQLVMQGPLPSQVSPESTSPSRQSLLLSIVFWGGLANAWMLALVVYLGQRSQRYIRESRRKHQQLQKELGERQRIELELRHSETSIRQLSARLELAVQSAGIGIWDWDIINDCLIWNDRMYELYGIESSSFLGIYEAWVNALHPQDLERATTAIHQAIQGEKDYEPEFRVIHPDGTIRYIQAYAVIQRDSQGQAQRMIGVNFDITDRKQAETERQKVENALQKSEALFQAFMDHSPAPAWITDVNGIMLYASQTYLRTFQFATDRLIGKSIFELYSSDVAQQFLDNIKIVAQTQKNLEMIEVAPRQDGTTGDFLVYKFPIPNESGEVLVGGVAIDMTQQHRAEEALRQSEERLQLALEASKDGLWDWDLTTGQVYLSPYYQEMLGYQPNELIMDGAVWENMIHPEDKPWVLEQLQKHFKDSSTQYSFDYRVRCKSGEWKWIADYGKVVAYDRQGKPLRMIGTHRDISDRKQKELALKQATEAAEGANLAKSMFLANMSHELRTPLNVILGFTQVMNHDPSLTPNQREDLQTIWRSGDHLLSLINDVLDLSKIEVGHCTLEEVGFDLISLLQTLRIMMTERAKSKGLQLEFDIAPEVPQFAIADGPKLRQTLLNLLSNAIKFTQQGSVTLHVKKKVRELETDRAEETAFCPHSMTLQFEVIDTGIGVAAKDLETIFEAFVQAEAGQKSVSGTGLGLTISRKLVELMKGEISVYSIQNVGSQFTVTVPVYPTTGVGIPVAQGSCLVAGLAPGQTHRRILVVDDEPENRLVLVRLLNQLGLKVQEATNGQDAIHIWQNWQPDLILMDIRMPGLDGYEATQQIRALEQGRVSIIIALTAQASQSDRTLALAAGCNDYITKPFREETLFLKLKEYLGLEFLYAEPNALPSGSSVLSLSPETDSAGSTLFDRRAIAELPIHWLEALEEAAVCGNDRAIVEQVSQFPPELASLAKQLKKLAESFQFEQILQQIHSSSSS